MTVCKFFQQGNCRYGSNCRFEHPAVANNRFGALASGDGGGNRGLKDALAKYSITTEGIEKDLTTDTPQWILSAYAPGRNAPEQLFGGFPREQSFEEMRMHYLTAKASGNEQQALNEAQELYHNAQQQMQTAVRNVQDAARFIVEAENKHPNRLDICREGTQGAPFGEFLIGKRPASVAHPAQQPNPFSTGAGSTASSLGGGTATLQTPSAFGQPAALGQRPNPFGAPAFGQPASAFGQPSQQASAFGQPSQPAAPAFGQSAQTTSAFGQASTLGAKPSPFGTPSFGQAAWAANPQGSAFGQVGQLGGAKQNPFASSGSANNAASPFGTVNVKNDNSAPPPANPFASSNTAPSNPTSSPFASSALNQNGNASQPNPFDQQQTSNPSPFGQAAQVAKSNPFAAAISSEPLQSSDPFAQNAQKQSNTPFGANASSNTFGENSSQSQNPFASGGSQTQQAPAAPAAAAASDARNPYPPGCAKHHPSIESHATKKMDGTLASFKGKAVSYKGNLPGILGFDGTWTRIWFPAGAPGYYKDTELPPEQYDETSKMQWAAFVQTGTFGDGIMPELPPRREFTQWDF
ncbi:uncharacterized protein UV8b_07399 [Ustilaginoidea virens]|uniref:C3H1-type domain-containing protein n=1 Tax=Ustilaginoidea virens TaxID=1159556 RepID=A0A8E5HX39_USTVR|nr:uncharacterized protein UV8b_07399 [Ustilaginoidea virens]QUC23158.1 hypothetical protein UV8b_07399 [Ustilaginoidea virens]